LREIMMTKCKGHHHQNFQSQAKVVFGHADDIERYPDMSEGLKEALPLEMKEALRLYREMRDCQYCWSQWERFGP
jgi:hypothetical protein